MKEPVESTIVIEREDADKLTLLPITVGIWARRFDDFPNSLLKEKQYGMAQTVTRR
jgi:hypothetical protein